MERNASFTPETVRSILVETVWGKITMHSAAIDTVHISAIGEEEALAELNLELENGSLTLRQPKYKLRIFFQPKPLEITVTVPEAWTGAIELSTVSAPISVRQLRGAPLSLGTVSGALSAFDLRAEKLSFSTVSGAIDLSSLAGKRLELNSVSGRMTATELRVREAEGNTVGGPADLRFAEDFESLHFSSVTGGLSLTLPSEQVRVQYDAVAGRLSYAGGDAPPEAPQVTVSSVSGGLSIYPLNRSEND